MVKNNKTCSFYVLYTQSDKAMVIDQSEHVQGPIYITNGKKNNEHKNVSLSCKPRTPEKTSGMFILLRPIRCEMKLQEMTAKPQH